jgi:hypothetical protein
MCLYAHTPCGLLHDLETIFIFKVCLVTAPIVPHFKNILAYLAKPVALTFAHCVQNLAPIHHDPVPIRDLITLNIQIGRL